MKKIKIRKKSNKETSTNETKKSKNTGALKTTILSLILIGGIVVISCILVFALYIIISSPDFDKQKLYSKESSVLYYADGTEMARIGSQDRVLVNYDELPQILVDAIVATEDSRYFQHSGIDIARFSKAVVGQLLGKAGAGGASTLTMQVVKQVYTNTNDSGIEGIIRKFTDIYMAVFKVESNYTKEEIIEFYVNTMWFGSDSNLYTEGISGIEQGCQHYFGKSVSDITLAEASILAGMFQNPRVLNPFTNPEGVRKRQTTVLNLMVLHEYITEEERDAVLAIPIESLVRDQSKDGNNNSNRAVIDLVLNEVAEKTGLNPSKTAMKIYTTIDPNTQEVLNQLERGELYDFPNEKLQEGIAITSTENGAIVALSGGRGYQAKGTNRADTKRQPGSTAKILFDYGPYLEKFQEASPGTMFLDESTTYSNGTAIRNSDRSYLGLISMRKALVQSRNIPALRAFKAVTKEDKNYISNFVHSLGIDYGKDLYESASIGGFDGVSPIQMSAAYAAYGRGGYYIEPYIYSKIEILETGETKEHKYEKVKVMSEETAYMITNMLMSAAENGVGGVKISGTDIAAKSGTTNISAADAERYKVPESATRDAWNITYNPEYCIALWIGYDRPTSEYYLTTKSGGNIRLAVMKAVGQKIYSKGKTFNRPSSVVSAEVEIGTYPLQLASEYTPYDLRSTELFRAGAEPTEVSNRFSKLSAPTNGNYTFAGNSVNLSWQGHTPDAADNTYLQEFFNKYYEEHASKYYESRLWYNNNYIGNFGYNVYLKDASGNLIYQGRTNTPSYTLNNVSNNSTYVIKSAYSLFTANMSDGLEIHITGIDNNISDMITDPNNNNNNNNSSNPPSTTKPPTDLDGNSSNDNTDNDLD
ncbi:MAG: transglycosylase domain-containing protein [Bacilli bacterium]|nr:transglycosylase domain-containing protein [Bacilli bacterium]